MDHLQKTKKIYKSLKKQETQDKKQNKTVYKNKLDKAYLQHDMAYGYFKNLTRITASDKILHNKAFNIAKNQKYDGYQRGLASMVYNFFEKKAEEGAATLANKSAAKNEIMQSKKLAEEFHKPFIRRFKKSKVYSSFIDNIWNADLADMQLIRKLKEFIFYYVLPIFLLNMHELCL